MRFTVDIDLDKAAFYVDVTEDGPDENWRSGDEVARLLRDLADGVSSEVIGDILTHGPTLTGNLRDINGNTVGSWSIIRP